MFFLIKQLFRGSQKFCIYSVAFNPRFCVLTVITLKLYLKFVNNIKEILFSPMMFSKFNICQKSSIICIPNGNVSFFNVPYLIQLKEKHGEYITSTKGKGFL